MILVTGAGGMVGSALVEELRRGGHPTRAAYHSPERARAATAAGQDAIALEMGDPDGVARALNGVESVFLLGAMSPDQTAHELGVVEAARTAGVRRLVKLSAWRADERLTPIADLHRPVEEALESSGPPWTLLRPNFYMQNFSRQMAAAIGRDGVLAQPASDGAISFVDARDVARVAAHVLTTDGHERRAYALSGPEALTYDQTAAVFADVLGRPVRHVALTDAQAREAMARAGLSAFHAEALIGVGRAYRHGGAEAVTADVERLTGRPPADLRRFAADHRAAFD